MGKKSFLAVVFFLSSAICFSQTPASASMDTIPAIKAEMNVNDHGALVYTMPIEVLKGINNHQPNLALEYNSQAGNGQAGWGWNISGISCITRGGKSQYVDGMTLGRQYDDTDPFYLDGQRLLKSGSSSFVTEKYSKIKIELGASPDNSFTIKYTDGKVARYKEIVPGQHYITTLEDASNNQIHYTYAVANNIALLTRVSYGADSSVTDPFAVNFIFTSRSIPVNSYRNGVLYRSEKYLSEINVSSSLITQNDGLYRKYKLTHVKIFDDSTEQLAKIELFNGRGAMMKPLEFVYDVNTGTNAERYREDLLKPTNGVGLGSVAIGDFLGTGKPYPIYEIKKAAHSYDLWSPKLGKLKSYDESKKIFAGRALFNNKITESDQLISLDVEYPDGEVYHLTDHLHFTFKNYITGEEKTVSFDIPGVLMTNPAYGTGNGNMDPQYDDDVNTTSPSIRDKTRRDYIVADFNNDGLVDVLVMQPNGDNMVNNLIFFAEIGKANDGFITPIQITPGDVGVNNYPVEFDGDGSPEIAAVNYSGELRILKLDLTTNKMRQVTEKIQLGNFIPAKTPLVFGDYNGDGLTDFIYPTKLYSLEGSSSAQELQKMESEQLLWWEYIATGKGFIRTLKDYTANKLAYILPTQRNVIKRSSGWEKFWSGKPDLYTHTEYGNSSVIAADLNNDGRSDLVSFKIFGKARYEVNLFDTDIISDSSISNSTTANKVFFHMTSVKPNGSVVLKNLGFTLPIERISPLSLVYSNRDANNLNIYQNEFIIHDALLGRDNKIVVNDGRFVEGRLKEVHNGSPIVQAIDYRPMVEKNNSDTQEVYTTGPTSLSYPYFRHRNVGTHYLVYKVHTLFDDKILTKEYRYKNAFQHLLGKGFIGFQVTLVSDLYESVIVNDKYGIKNPFEGIFWTINSYDPELDNAISSTSYGSLNPGSVFNRTYYTNQRFEMGNKRYLILPISERSVDYLKDVTITKDYTYDTGQDLLLSQALTDYNGVGIAIEKFSYTPEFGDQEHNFFGKIKSIEKSTFKDGLVFSTKEEQDYNPDGTILQTRKFGNNTPALVTDYTYFAFGEVKNEKTTTQGSDTVLEVAYQYDPTHRFLWKITNPDGLISTSNANIAGKVVSEVSGLGLTTTYKHDHWGNVKETTNFLGKKTFISKEPGTSIAGEYKIRTKVEGGSETVTTYDKFDREIAVKTKALNDSWVTILAEYDVFGKKVRFSESFLEGDAIKWNTIEYDDIDRPVVHTSFNGKVIKTCYEGLKVTVEEGHKKTIKWMDAMGHTVKHQDAGGMIFYKYYPNGSLRESSYEGIKTTIGIDGWGNRILFSDPSAGTYHYEYDNFSKIKKETNPSGGTTEYFYDTIGRLITETSISNSEQTNTIKNYAYNPSTSLLENISGTANDKSFSYTTFYNDPYYRVTGKKEQTPDFTYQTTTSYDGYGRVDITEQKVILNNPSATTVTQIKNVYNTDGLLVKQLDQQTSGLIWQINAVNSHGQTTNVTFGNGYTTNSTYNSDNFSLENIRHYNDSRTVVDINYGYDITRGVLLSRNNQLFGKHEEFQYDDLDRLVGENLNGIAEREYSYDKRGRMTSNSELGKYNYNQQNYQIDNINFNENGATIGNSRGFANITYNMFKSPNEIILEGKDRVSYEYSILNTRSACYYGSLSPEAGNRPNRKFYSSDKAVEIIKEGDIVKIITYITGDAYTANYIKIDLINNGSLTSSNKYYLHRDNQGSILAITKASSGGEVVEKRFFDAWGNLRAALLGNDTDVLLPDAMGWIPELLLDRGYTGHEHIKSVGLIHMNGRIYDPVLRRFMSPDDYVQDPYNSQNFNRYGYVYNNPLLYVDPSGEFGFVAAVIVGVVVGILANGINNMAHDIPFWYGAGKSGTMGAVSAAISFGIGSLATSSFTSTFNQALFQAGMHGYVGGVMSAANEGNFFSGFAAGMVSSIVSSGIQGLGVTNGELNSFGDSSLQKVTMIAAGGLSGGLSSSIAGGNFWYGVQQGLITSGLNHLAHSGIAITKKAIFDGQINKAYGSKKNADAHIFRGSEEQYKEEIYNIIRKVKILNTQFQRILAKNKLFYLDYTPNAQGTDAAKTFYDIVDGKAVNLMVYVYSKAMDSPRYLAYTILHEFGHSWSAIIGFNVGLYNDPKIGKTRIPYWIDELYARDFALYHGGVPYDSYYKIHTEQLNGSARPVNTVKFPKY